MKIIGHLFLVTFFILPAFSNLSSPAPFTLSTICSDPSGLIHCDAFTHSSKHHVPSFFIGALETDHEFLHGNLMIRGPENHTAYHSYEDHGVSIKTYRCKAPERTVLNIHVYSIQATIRTRKQDHGFMEFLRKLTSLTGLAAGVLRLRFFRTPSSSSSS